MPLHLNGKRFGCALDFLKITILERLRYNV